MEGFKVIRRVSTLVYNSVSTSGAFGTTSRPTRLVVTFWADGVLLLNALVPGIIALRLNADNMLSV